MIKDISNIIIHYYNQIVSLRVFIRDFPIFRYIKHLSLNRILKEAAFHNHRKLIDCVINKGVDDWELGMMGAAEGGHLDLVKEFIDRGNPRDSSWYCYGLEAAAKGGYLDLVEFFIEKGATNFNYGLKWAAFGGHIDLVEFFIARGAHSWNKAFEAALNGGNYWLLDFFIEKGANSCIVGEYQKMKSNVLK